MSQARENYYKAVWPSFGPESNPWLNRIVKDYVTQLESDKAELISLIQELKDSAEYWSEYEVPIGIVDRIREAVKKHGGEI